MIDLEINGGSLRLPAGPGPGMLPWREPGADQDPVDGFTARLVRVMA